MIRIKKCFCLLLCGTMLFALVSCKKENNHKKANSVPSTNEFESTNKEDDSMNNLSTQVLDIICWGDSITEGYLTQCEYTYPAVLQMLLGDKYNVINAGYGGDSSWAIAARQGAYVVNTKNDIMFPDGIKTVVIGHRITGMGLMLDDGTELSKLNVSKMLQIDTDPSKFPFLGANPITIDKCKYQLGISFEGIERPLKDGDYYVTLTRTDSNESLTIPSGTTVQFSNSELSTKNYCDIYLMGANDKLGDTPSVEDINLLVSRYKRMVKHRTDDKYIIIIPFWTDAYDNAFEKAFGNHAINFRKLAVSNGLQDVGIIATDVDNSLISKGRIPASFRYNNDTSQVHLNEAGYGYLASLIYNQGISLGYWE